MKSPLSLRSFTLLELMLAMTVTMIIVGILIIILDVTTLAIKGSRRILDSNQHACFAFDRMRFDLKKIVLRKDVQPFFTNAALGEEGLRFLSTIKGPHSDRSVSLIGYRLVSDKTGFPSLERGIHGYGWDDTGFMGLDSQGKPTDLIRLPEPLNLQENDYETLIGGVLQWSIAFQYKSDGKIYKSPPLTSNLLESTNIASIIVGLALVDYKNTPPLNPEQYEALVSPFSHPPDGVTPQSHWQSNLTSTAFWQEIRNHVPQKISSSIHIYQRFFPIE